MPRKLAIACQNLKIQEHARAMSSPTKKECIAKGLTNCKFVVKDNPNANGEAPLYELHMFSAVDQHSALIDRVAQETGVESRLIRAIMYMETTHGYYDAPVSWIGKNKSILPMNINVEYWGTTFGDRASLARPYDNIKAGAEMLNRIIANLPHGASVRQIATLYNNINAGSVNDYGARVEAIYNAEPWK